MYRVLQILTDEEVAECRRIAASAPFVDGRITNPHRPAKQNEQLHEPAAYQKSSRPPAQGDAASPEFMEFAFPVVDGAADDDPVQAGDEIWRACRRRLHPASRRDDPKRPQLHHLPQRSRSDYDGGELRLGLGDADLSFKLKPGEAMIYPSDTFHQVVPVTRGERLVAITFIQSRIPTRSAATCCSS